MKIIARNARKLRFRAKRKKLILQVGRRDLSYDGPGNVPPIIWQDATLEDIEVYDREWKDG